MLWSAAGGLGCKGSKVPDAGPIPATVIPAVVFAGDSGVTDDVKAECGLERRIPAWIADNAPGATPGAANGAGRVLTLEITGIMGAGGGAWSGPKQIRMSGTLADNGQVIGTFKARRTTTGGMWGGYKGTCSMLEICGEELGEDVGAWLQNPTMDARLGEL